MRKILTLIALIAIFCGCSKDDEKDGPRKQTFFVNVYEQYSASLSKKFAEPSTVFLYKDIGKTINYRESSSSVKIDNKLTYADGTTSEKYNYTSNSVTGVNTFKSIPNGEYILWVTYAPYSFLIKSSSKTITVHSKMNLKTEELIFTGADFGYREWNRPW